MSEYNALEEDLFELPPSKSSILDDISLYIENISNRYKVVNVVLIIAISYISATIISIFKININY